MDKSLARFTKKRRERTQMNKIRNEKGEISMDTAEIQKTVREYDEQLYANKFDNLEETDNFLETYSLPKLNQEEIDELNRLITRNKIEYIIKTLPTNKSQGLDGFKAHSTKHTKRNLQPSFLKFSKRLKKKKHSQRHSMRPASH